MALTPESRPAWQSRGNLQPANTIQPMVGVYYDVAGNPQQTYLQASPPPGTSTGSVTPQPVVDPPIVGYGTLAVGAGSSTLVSTLTTGPNSPAWPSTLGQTFFLNTGANTLYACPLGGTCSASVGIPIAPGTSYGFNGPASTATVFATAATTLIVQW